MTDSARLADAGLIGCCAKCRTRVIEHCPTCARPGPKPIYMERQLRLNTLQNHTESFCQVCALDLQPGDFPAIALSIRLKFEEQWKALKAPREFVERERARWAQIEVIGLAEEIPGIEHGRALPTVTVHRDCNQPVVLGLRKSRNIVTEEMVETNEPCLVCSHCGDEATSETTVTKQRLVTRAEMLAPHDPEPASAA